MDSHVTSVTDVSGPAYETLGEIIQCSAIPKSQIIDKTEGWHGALCTRGNGDTMATSWDIDY